MLKGCAQEKLKVKGCAQVRTRGYAQEMRGSAQDLETRT